MGFLTAHLTESAPDALVCSVCTEVLENPVVTPCRHVYCHKCLHDWLKTQGNCPKCRRALSQGEIENAPPYFTNIIADLKVTCEWRAEGCGVEVALYRLPAHREECPYAPVPCRHVGCPNKGTHTQLRRHTQQAHEGVCEWRPVPCPFGCGHTLTVRELNEHQSECSTIEVPCPLQCGARLPRGLLEAHRTDWRPRAHVQCHVSGCEIELERLDLPSHMIAHVQTLQENVANLSTRLHETTSQLKTDIKTIDQSVATIRRQHSARTIAPLSLAYSRSIRLHDQIVRYGSAIAICAIVAVIFDWLELFNGSMALAVALCTAVFLGHDAINRHSQLLASQTSTHAFLVDGVAKMRAEDGLAVSDVMSIGGYAFRIELMPNGYGRTHGTHIFVSVACLKGDNDPWLTWPCYPTITLRLAGKNGTHHAKTLTAKRGFKPGDTLGTSMIGWENARRGGFLVGDSLLVVAEICLP